MPRVNLTDRFVHNAKPGASGRAEYFDAGTPGLSLRVSDGGKKSWSYFFTSPKDGKRARFTLGAYPSTSLVGARTRAIEAKGHVDDGNDPRDMGNASAITVATLVASYLQKHVRPNLRTAKEIERRFEKNILPSMGSIRLGDLHRRDVNRAVDPIMARGRAIEAARCFEDVRALLRWGLARGDLDRNPVDGMRKPATSTPRERVLSDEEIRTLWTKLPVALAKSKSAQRIVKLCLITAQRVGEVSGMAAAELDLDERTWTLPGARTKNGHGHRIPLTPLALEIIAQAMKDAGEGAAFVFPNTDGDGPLPAQAVAKTVMRAQERLGLAHWTMHDLRRSAVTGMASLGVAPIVLGHIINHRSVTRAGVTLSVYSHYDYGAEREQALQLWSERLSAIVAGDTAKVIPLQRGNPISA
ncbi:MAG TPA: tyrosine-type recombinase/integrase [Rhizomicrobium sp.]